MKLVHDVKSKTLGPLNTMINCARLKLEGVSQGYLCSPLGVFLKTGRNSNLPR